ncbi:MAG: hypothetical protein R2909_06560 [Gemmatimonadales bacterium]
MNVDQQLTPRLDLSFSSFYGRSDNQDAAQGPGAPFFAVQFVEPLDLFARCDDTPPCTAEEGNPDGSPYRAFIPDRVANATNPLYELFNRDRRNDRSRFTGSARLRWRIADWLIAEGNYNFDQERVDSSDVTPFGFIGPTGQATDGNIVGASISGRTYNTGATLTAIRSFGEITNTTKLSFIYEDQNAARLFSQGSKLVVSRVPEFDAVDPSTLSSTSSDIRHPDRSFFAVTAFHRHRGPLHPRRRSGVISRPCSVEASRPPTAPPVGRLAANEDLKIGGMSTNCGCVARTGPPTSARCSAIGTRRSTSTAGRSRRRSSATRTVESPARSSSSKSARTSNPGGGGVTLEYTAEEDHQGPDPAGRIPPAVVGFLEQWQNVGTLQSKTHSSRSACSCSNGGTPPSRSTSQAIGPGRPSPTIRCPRRWWARSPPSSSAPAAPSA